MTCKRTRYKGGVHDFWLAKNWGKLSVRAKVEHGIVLGTASHLTQTF